MRAIPVLATLALALLAQPAAAETFTLRIGAGHPPNALGYAIAAKEHFQPEVARRVEAETKHKIVWVEGYAGTIAKLSEMIDAIKVGLLDVGAISQPFEPTKMFLHNMASYVPFGETDPTKALDAYRKVYDQMPWFREQFEKQWNQKHLGIGTQSDYGLGTKFAWSKFEDLKGHKLSAAGPNLPWLSNTGAIPVQTNLNEAYNSLQSGVYEGVVIFPGPWYGFKLHEVAGNFKLVGFGSIPWNSLTINMNTYRKLPPEVQKIMVEVGKTYELAAAKIETETFERSQKQLADAGAKVTALPFEERVKWATALKDLPNAQAQEAKKRGMPGPQAMKLLMKVTKEAGYKYPYDYEIKD